MAAPVFGVFIANWDRDVRLNCPHMVALIRPPAPYRAGLEKYIFGPLFFWQTCFGDEIGLEKLAKLLFNSKFCVRENYLNMVALFLSIFLYCKTYCDIAVYLWACRFYNTESKLLLLSQSESQKTPESLAVTDQTTKTATH